VLVYAVCTLTGEESEGVVQDFVAAHPTFGVEPAARVLPDGARELCDAQGFVRTLPSRHGLDGFFAARLARGPALG
jgi:16S rRNA (cytosine967-C5)-methyltransferase